MLGAFGSYFLILSSSAIAAEVYKVQCHFLVSLLRRTLVSTGMFRLSVKHASSGFAS